MKQLDKRGYTL